MAKHQVGGVGQVSFVNGFLKRGKKRGKRRAQLVDQAPCGFERLEDRILLAADFAVVDRINVALGGVEPNGVTQDVTVSANGRFIVFSSTASNLVADDTNNASDVFLFDTMTETIERVSVNTNEQPGNQGSFEGVVSSDGRYVVFRSLATNLGGSGNTVVGEIYLRDRTAGTTTRVSNTVSLGGMGGFDPSVSSNGNYVTWVSETTDGVNNAEQVYRFSFVAPHAGVTELLSFADPLPGNADSGSPVVATDGDVVFHSSASDLVAGDTNGVSDIFLWLAGPGGEIGTVTRLFDGIGGAQPNGASFNAEISSDGRYVVFESDASNLVAGDDNGQRDVFLFDRNTGSMQLVSVATSGDQANGGSFNPAVSDNGRSVVFASAATNLQTGDDNGQIDIFLRDITAGTTKLLSANAAGDEGNSASTRPDISGNGSLIVFQSTASNLIATDANGASDVFGVKSTFTAINGVDLRPQITLAKVPAALIGGQSAKGSIKLDVSNIGSTPTAVGQTADVQVLLRPTGGGDDIVLGTSTVNVSNLAAGRSKAANVSFTIPGTVPTGTYDVVAIVDPNAQVVGEVDAGNNTVVHTQQLVVADPFVNLDVQVNDALPTVMVPGDRGRLLVLINNIGNVATMGALNVRVFASTDQSLDGGDLLLGETDRNLRLQPGKAAKVNFNFRGFESNVPEGDYFIIVDVQPISGDQLLLDAGRAIEVGDVEHEIIWGFGEVGDRKNVRLTLLDQQNVPVTFMLTGAGTGTVDLDAEGFDINIENANNSTVRFITKSSELLIDDVTSDGPINSLDGGKTGNLVGDVNINGGVNRLKFNDVTNASATINGPLNIFQANNVSNFQLTATDQTINRVMVNEWIGGGVTAGVVNTLMTRRGDFAADVNAVSLNMARIGADLRDSNFVLTQAVGAGPAVNMLSAKGDIENVTVRSAGDINRVMANGIINSTILAGVDPAETGLPDSADDFVAASVISQVRAKMFQGSQIGSSVLGRIDLGEVVSDNGGFATGLSTRSFDQISYILNGNKVVARASDFGSVVVEDDFVVRLL